MKRVGILSLQGSIIEHEKMLEKLPAVNVERVKYPKDLKEIDGLIIPGGESTTIGKLLDDFALLDPIRAEISKGLPVWGTCAGLILLAKRIEGAESAYVGAMDIDVKTNAYGGQLDSFVVKEEIEEIGDLPVELVFIRAPYILNVGKGVAILKELKGKIVAAREKNMLVTSFHPELTEDKRIHEYFLNMM